LLNEVLRQEWGFDGFVITDCGALGMLVNGHNVAASGEEAVKLALESGTDMEMSGEMFNKHLLSAIEQGLLSEEMLNQAVLRVLSLKYELGLFDRPMVDPAKAAQVIGSPEHKQLARKMAAEGIVLLKNERQALPLNKNIGKIAVIGPNANAPYNQLGDYTSPQEEGQIATLLDGMRAALGEERVLYAPGCRIKEAAREGFATALDCARQADAIIVAIGGSSARDFGEGTIDLVTGASVVTDNALSEMECGEGIDRMTLNLLGSQLELVQELRKLDKPLIVVYINGRPIVEPWIVEQADAIVEAWYPGQEGGHALADILFGIVNPSGKLTVSIPRHVGQLPVYYYKRRTRGKRYLEMDFEAQYPFGYGLSYTSFEYAELRIEYTAADEEGYAAAVITVRNSGQLAGQEVVQLYVADHAATVTRPQKMLKGFRKIWLEPGESKQVRFVIGREQLEFVGQQLQRVVEDGDFTIMIGSSSLDYLEAPLRVSSEGRLS
jgi:beta-glucosidase